MGVPKLFKTLTLRYPKILYNQPYHYDALYFDLNCLIHPVCAQFANEPNHVKFTKIKEYISLVVQHVNPNCHVYLFIDGVAPFAKVIQQRQRRFKSIYLKKKKLEIAQKLNILTQETSWDSNAISPKTFFMDELYEFLKQAFPNYIVSPTDEPGEGEHKIVDSVLKSNYRSVCIYGLDADLIILSWVISILRPKIHVSLVREYTKFGIKKSDSPFHFMDINKLMNHFYHDLNLHTNKENECADFILLTFLLGNDFLPNLFGVSLHAKGYELLLNTYIYCKRSFPQFQIVYLNNKKNPISWKCLHLFFSVIHKNQSHILEDFMNAYFKYHPREPEFMSPLDKEMYQFEFISQKSDPVRINTHGWEERFMQRYHYVSEKPFDTMSAFGIVDNYLAGLLWNLKYYFKIDSDLSYGFLFSHPMSPPLKYIISRLESQYYAPLHLEHFWKRTEIEKPLHPHTALSLILPMESFHLFDHSRIKVKPLSVDSGDTQFITDYKHFWGESYVILPSVDYIFYLKS